MQLLLIFLSSAITFQIHCWRSYLVIFLVIVDRSGLTAYNIARCIFKISIAFCWSRLIVVTYMCPNILHSTLAGGL